MIKSREPYYWSNHRIKKEYNLIQQKESTLSATQRKAVEHIYSKMLKAGNIPGQKKALSAEMDASFKAAKGALIRLCQSLGVEKPGHEHLQKFSLLLDYPTQGEIANYLLSIHGHFLGWIKVYKEKNGYKAKYYVEEKEQSRAKEISHSSEEKRA